MREYGEWMYNPRFLDLGAIGGEWSASRPGRCTPGEIAPQYTLESSSSEYRLTVWKPLTYAITLKTEGVRSPETAVTDRTTHRQSRRYYSLREIPSCSLKDVGGVTTRGR
jgi:hypothetical protein